MLDLTVVDRLLTTTRAVRKRLDLERPVEPEVIERCLEIATQAPSGSDRQRWHFVVITDPALRQGLAALYRRAFWAYFGAPQGPHGGPYLTSTPLQESAVHLAEQFHRIPVQVLFCYEGRVEDRGPLAQASLYGSILPAVWSFMLALRARGLGSVWTTLHLRYEREAAALLGLPENLTQAALIPVAHYTGDDFRPARRAPARQCTHWNGWGRRRNDGAAAAEADAPGGDVPGDVE